MQRDSNEFYIVVISTTAIRVFDKTGVERTVSGSAAYLSGLTSPATELAATTVNDFTFILNKSTTANTNVNLSVSRPPEALVYVKKGEYSTTYNITITKGGASYASTYTTSSSTQDSTSAANSAELTTRTTNITTNLQSFNSGGNPLNVNIVNYGNILHFQSTDGVDFEITCSDGLGDTALLSFKDTVADFKTLPPEGPTGYKIAVVGDNTKGQDDYYVELRQPTSNGKQVWKETLKDAVKFSLDYATLPHKLVSNANGTFTFAHVTWDDRKVGDDDTNPVPSFIGKKINDVFFFKNRLGFLSGENIIMSENGSFYNFFVKTVLTTLDSGPIDASVSNNQVSVLKHAVPFDSSLLLFSDLNQFKLEGDGILTNETLSINVSTSFEADLTAKPVSAGKNVYFATGRNSFAGLREYFVDSDVETNDAADITAHVPTYLQGSITDLAASSNEDMLLVKGSTENNVMYVYSYYWQGREKLQAAWSKWTFSGTIRNFLFKKSDIYIITDDSNGGTILERISLNQQPTTVNAITNATKPFIPLLDRSYKISANDFTNNQFVAPYYNADGKIVGSDGSVFDSVVDFNANVPSTGEFWYGIPYLFQYTFSEIIMKLAEQPVTDGRLQLRNMTVAFNGTATFETLVSHQARPTKATVFNANTLNSSQSSLNNISITSGYYKFGILGESSSISVTLKNYEYTPCIFQSAEWEGIFNPRNRRI
tara:strand:+ start:5946 stop:8081 length:2136 start_codon:yes stop_codon:yes gene_type:complete